MREKSSSKAYNAGLTEKYYRYLYYRLVDWTLGVGAPINPHLEP